MSIGRVVVHIQFIEALALQVVIAAAMIRRRLLPQARFFFVYIAWQTFSVLCMYGITFKLPPIFSFYAYWINDAIDVILAIAILIEIFDRMFAAYEGVRRLAKILFCVAAIVVTMVSAIFLRFDHVEYTVPVLTLVLVAERSVRILQLGLILALFAITRYLHLRWKNYLFGIALGFGFYATTTLAVLVVRMTYGEPVMIVSSVLWGTGYCIAVLIWTVYVLQPEAARIPILSLPSPQLDLWDATLKRALSTRQ